MKFSYGRNLRLLPAAIALSSCYSHNFPRVQSFPFADHHNTPARLSVDANGTFYPNNWGNYGLPRSPWRQGSLLAQLRGNQEALIRLRREEKRQLDEVARYIADKNRVFILVHGYNNTAPEAEAGFADITDRLSTSQGDAMIWFGWDGLTGKLAGAGRIWFNATGYSQLAGGRGLRRLLATIAGKNIYLISHSRGASVVLSALSNPTYDPRFLARTRGVLDALGEDPDDFLRPLALPDRGNRIRILMLAPAIDRIDFCDARYQPNRPGAYACPGLRDLGPQVHSLSYTINGGDRVLKKFVGASRFYNPTGLGLNPATGRQIEERYAFMRAYQFRTPMNAHRFRAYVAHPCFTRMIEDQGLTASATQTGSALGSRLTTC